MPTVGKLNKHKRTFNHTETRLVTKYHLIISKWSYHNATILQTSNSKDIGYHQHQDRKNAKIDMNVITEKIKENMNPTH